jgi:hypothetical protein
MYGILAGWLSEISCAYVSERYSFFLALSIVRYAMSQDIAMKRGSLQLLGACSMMLAHLIRSDTMLTTPEWCDVSAGDFTDTEFTQSTRTLFQSSYRILGLPTSYTILVDRMYHQYDTDDDAVPPPGFTQGPLLALWMLEVWGVSWYFPPAALATLAIRCTNPLLSKDVFNTLADSVPTTFLVSSIRSVNVPPPTIASDFELVPGIQYLLDWSVMYCRVK